MREINFSRKEIENLTLYNKGGFEGKIYIYSHDLVIKVFEEYLRGILDFESKKYKLIRLSEMNMDKKIMIIPETIVNIDRNFSGYIMPKIEDSITLNNIKDYRKLIKIYSTLFNHLEVLHSNKIIINDVKPENILLLNNHHPIFIDVDSMGVGELPADNLGVKSYISKIIPNVDEKQKCNSLESMDKLKLIASFLYTLKGKDGNSVMQNLFLTDFSKEFKSFLATVMRTDGNLSSLLNEVNEMFFKEEMLERGRRR